MVHRKSGLVILKSQLDVAIDNDRLNYLESMVTSCVSKQNDLQVFIKSQSQLIDSIRQDNLTLKSKLSSLESLFFNDNSQLYTSAVIDNQDSYLVEVESQGNNILAEKNNQYSGPTDANASCFQSANPNANSIINDNESTVSNSIEESQGGNNIQHSEINQPGISNLENEMNNLN